MDKLSIEMMKAISPLLSELMEKAKLDEWETKIFYYIMFQELTPRQIETRGLVPYTERNIYYIYKKARKKINRILP